jgi:hypothetical protein
MGIPATAAATLILSFCSAVGATHIRLLPSALILAPALAFFIGNPFLLGIGIIDAIAQVAIQFWLICSRTPLLITLFSSD